MSKNDKKENFINLFTRQSEIIMLKSDNASNNEIINFTLVMEYYDSGPCWKSIKYAIFCECIDCERFLVIANKWQMFSKEMRRTLRKCTKNPFCTWTFYICYWSLIRILNFWSFRVNLSKRTYVHQYADDQGLIGQRTMALKVREVAHRSWRIFRIYRPQRFSIL